LFKQELRNILIELSTGRETSRALGRILQIGT
jgi:hypothetical protein